MNSIDIFDTIFNTPYISSIKYYHHGPITFFYLTGWMNLVQILYHELIKIYTAILTAMYSKMNKIHNPSNTHLFEIIQYNR